MPDGPTTVGAVTQEYPDGSVGRYVRERWGAPPEPEDRPAEPPVADEPAESADPAPLRAVPDPQPPSPAPTIDLDEDEPAPPARDGGRAERAAARQKWTSPGEIRAAQPR